MNRRRTARSTPPWYICVFGAIAIVAVILAVAQLGTATSSAARTYTETVAAENGVVQTTVSGTGSVEPGVDDDVNFATSGTLTSVDVKLGQHVKKGQLIATLDPSSAELTLASARLTLTEDEDELTAAEDGDSSDSSDTDSSGEDTTTDSSSTSSAASIAAAELEVETQKQTVETDETAVRDTKLYAPATGTIASLAGDTVGETVSSGTDSDSSQDSSSDSSDDDDTSTSSSTSTDSDTSSAFAEIINSKTMTMSVSVSETDISELKVGQMATVSFSALSGVELAGKVTSISPLGTASDDVVTYDATVTIYQYNAKVLPGMSATATIVVSQAQGVTVPTDALTGTGSTGYVKLDEDGKTVEKEVVVGLRGADRAVIVSDLKAGQDVVITESLPSVTSSSSTTNSTSTTTTATAGESDGDAAGPATGGGFARGGAP